ncbi:MAG: hypothetical protein HZA12_05355 [Nitrospirae bacterium]|nr:hypothetical protein [Nitrospirota bacterium]
MDTKLKIDITASVTSIMFRIDFLLIILLLLAETSMVSWCQSFDLNTIKKAMNATRFVQVIDLHGLNCKNSLFSLLISDYLKRFTSSL